MKTIRLVLGFLMFLAAVAGSARAQAQRTFVASGGSIFSRGNNTITAKGPILAP